MDGQRFDALTKALVGPSSRRRMLKGLVGGVLGGTLGSVGVREAVAQVRCPREEPINCNGTCVDLRTNPANCGRCGTFCDSNICYAGRCLNACPTGFAACGGTCYRACSGGQELNPETCACETVVHNVCSNPFNTETCLFESACVGCQVGDTCVGIFEGGGFCATAAEGGTICGMPTTNCGVFCESSDDCAAGQRCAETCCDGGTRMICYDISEV